MQAEQAGTVERSLHLQAVALLVLAVLSGVTVLPVCSVPTHTSFARSELIKRGPHPRGRTRSSSPFTDSSSAVGAGQTGRQVPIIFSCTLTLVELPAPEADERELLLAWLQALRDSVLRKAEGLDEDQARWRPEGRLISVAGILNHLAHVEWRWIDGALRGDPVSRSEDEFVVPVMRPVSQVVDAYRVRAARTDEIVRGSDLLQACHHPRHPGINLRWVLLHLIEETARHAGHADATREFLDGKTGD